MEKLNINFAELMAVSQAIWDLLNEMKPKPALAMLALLGCCGEVYFMTSKGMTESDKEMLKKYLIDFFTKYLEADKKEELTDLIKTVSLQ